MRDLTKEEEIMPFAARKALEAVLLFHSGSPWTPEKQDAWQEFGFATLGKPPKFEDYHYARKSDRPDTFEATTRVLCEMVRAALGRINEGKP